MAFDSLGVPIGASPGILPDSYMRIGKSGLKSVANVFEREVEVKL